ncbi:amidohydrolase family protein [Angustibacter sp. McL0619]|uniref:amidohydrolase family protein n=1 Tax=Angustibacter sp. McL0619 TaxID=3415676 RepID=UPI003CFA030A
MWAIRGRILAMSDHPDVPTAASGAFAGTVWLADDGRIAAVTSSRQRVPAGFEGAEILDVGTSLVMPGLIDLHNHLAYNTLPLWTEPKQQVAFLHHNSWTRAPTYSASTTWPAYALITACPGELLAYVETKAIVGGTTTIQGSPPMNRPRDGWLVRNVEDESFGTGDDDRIYASTLTGKPQMLADRANGMRRGSTFIYHCAEGQPETVVAREFVDAELAGCLQARFVAVHANAADTSRFAAWKARPGAIAWSPFSNLWLYGRTTDVPAAQREKITVCLGSDWAPSGTKHVLGEVKVARLVSDALGWGFTDQQLVAMMTSAPGDVLARSWRRQLGRLQPKAIGDVVVLRASPRADPYGAVVAATERDVQLVVIAGQPRYGTTALMDAAGATPLTTVTIAGEDRSLRLTTPDDADSGWQWQDVLKRMEKVRKNPKAEIEAAQGRLAAFGGRLDHREAPLRLALDMPSGLGPVGGLPKDLGEVHVPELQSLEHDADWLKSLVGRGFHRGLLDDLARYYPA